MKRLALILLCGCGGLAQGATPDITFHGSLVSPPVCTISDDKTIEIEFRDVIIDSINGDYARKEVPYEITCDSQARDDAWEMTLTWTGTETSYDNAAIETDVPGLGIGLLHDGQRFQLNTPLPIDVDKKPKLEAVPVKASDAVLSDGTFSAYATLRVDYQ